MSQNYQQKLTVFLFYFIFQQISNTLEALKPSVGPKLEGLLLNSDSDSDFDPRAEESDNSNGNKITNDLFGFEPPKSLGQTLFTSGNLSSGNITNGSSAFNGPPVSPAPLCMITSKKTLLDLFYIFFSFFRFLVAPPPKAATPRRTGSANNFQANGKPDLFGSDPFTPFNVSN